MRILVAGASGFVGRRLCAELSRSGHEVRAMTRHPERYDGPGMPVLGDVHQPDTLRGALSGCDAAYYLVHSLAASDFERNGGHVVAGSGMDQRGMGTQRLTESGEGTVMTPNTLTRALVVVGGLNWGLVGLARFDLVATLTGNRFGGTNAASRLVYGLVGAAAAVEAVELAQTLKDR